MNSKQSILGLIFLSVLGYIMLSLFLAYPFQLLWNYSLVGTISIINEISFLQATGLLFLINLVRFSSFSYTKKNK
jgi:hypothetical protein